MQFPPLISTPTMESLDLRHKEHHRSGYKEAGGAKKASLMYYIDADLWNQLYGFLNMICMLAIAVDMPMQMEKISQGPVPR